MGSEPGGRSKWSAGVLRAGLLLLLLLLARRSGVMAQVPVVNDQLAGRLPLVVGEARESRTDGCTVEWGCVDEKLTGRQIDYHNDQWFSFRPPRAGQYYVNVGGQQCREVRGVQLVVLTAGELCRPSTYSILSATSLGTQDDIFVPLTAAVAGQEILLCVDGYLHDYCRFRLSVDTVARGVPAVSPPKPGGEGVSTRIVPLKWELPDSLGAATRFVVRRRAMKEARATEVATLAVRRNAAGGVERRYATADTLPGPGQYAYQIVVEGAEAPVVVQQRAIAYSAGLARPVEGQLVLPTDRFRVGASLRVVVTDVFAGRIVQRVQLVRPESGGALTLPVAGLVQQGVRRIRVSITDPDGPRGVVTEELEAAL